MPKLHFFFFASFQKFPQNSLDNWIETRLLLITNQFPCWRPHSLVSSAVLNSVYQLATVLASHPMHPDWNMSINVSEWIWGALYCALLSYQSCLGERSTAAAWRTEGFWVMPGMFFWASYSNAYRESPVKWPAFLFFFFLNSLQWYCTELRHCKEEICLHITSPRKCVTGTNTIVPFDTHWVCGGDFQWRRERGTAALPLKPPWVLSLRHCNHSTVNTTWW